MDECFKNYLNTNKLLSEKNTNTPVLGLTSCKHSVISLLSASVFISSGWTSMVFTANAHYKMHLHTYKLPNIMYLTPLLNSLDVPTEAGFVLVLRSLGQTPSQLPPITQMDTNGRWTQDHSMQIRCLNHWTTAVIYTYEYTTVVP